MHTQTMSDMYKHTYIYTTTYTRTHTAVHVHTYTLTPTLPTHKHRAYTHGSVLYSFLSYIIIIMLYEYRPIISSQAQLQINNTHTQVLPPHFLKAFYAHYTFIRVGLCTRGRDIPQSHPPIGLLIEVFRVKPIHRPRPVLVTQKFNFLTPPCCG